MCSKACCAVAELATVNVYFLSDPRHEWWNRRSLTEFRGRGFKLNTSFFILRYTQDRVGLPSYYTTLIFVSTTATSRGVRSRFERRIELARMEQNRMALRTAFVFKPAVGLRLEERRKMAKNQKRSELSLAFFKTIVKWLECRSGFSHCTVNFSVDVVVLFCNLQCRVYECTGWLRLGVRSLPLRSLYALYTSVVLSLASTVYCMYRTTTAPTVRSKLYAVVRRTFAAQRASGRASRKYMYSTMSF